MLTDEQREGLRLRREEKLAEIRPDIDGDPNNGETWHAYLMRHILDSNPDIALQVERELRRNGKSRALDLVVDLLYLQVYHAGESPKEEMEYLQTKYPEFMLIETIKAAPGLQGLRPFKDIESLIPKIDERR